MSHQTQVKQERARVCPLIEDPGNRRLLESYLEAHDRFVLVPPGDSLTDTAFDVAILDAAALETHTAALDEAKRVAEPVLLPYLLLVPRAEPDLIATDDGQLVDSVLTRTIDEIVTLPIEQSELQWRIDALLRLRTQSIEAHEQGKVYRSLFDSIQNAIVVTDAGGILTDINPAGTELFGIDASSLRGTHVESFFDDSDAFETLVANLNANPDGVKFTKVLRFTRGPEDTFPGELTVSRLTDEDGTTTGYIGEVRDDTDRQERIERIERLAEYRRVASTVNHLLVESTPDERVFPAITEAIASSDRFGCTFLA
ncbi:MAG: PAS domain S-box protein, partial [Halodesulfurarchaeum sp.]